MGTITACVADNVTARVFIDLPLAPVTLSLSSSPVVSDVEMVVSGEATGVGTEHNRVYTKNICNFYGTMHAHAQYFTVAIPEL